MGLVLNWQTENTSLVVHARHESFKWCTLDLLFFCVVCFFYSIWKPHLCHTAGEETSVFNKIDAVLLVVSCGSEALWMFANAKWATWNPFRYVLWQTGCKHHIWAKLALPCWPVNEYIAAIKKTRVQRVYRFSLTGESCIHWGTDYGHFCIIIYSRNRNLCFKQCASFLYFTNEIHRKYLQNAREVPNFSNLCHLWYFRTNIRKANIWTLDYECLLTWCFTKIRHSNECAMDSQ